MPGGAQVCLRVLAVRTPPPSAQAIRNANPKNRPSNPSPTTPHSTTLCPAAHNTQQRARRLYPLPSSPEGRYGKRGTQGTGWTWQTTATYPIGERRLQHTQRLRQREGRQVCQRWGRGSNVLTGCQTTGVEQVWLRVLAGVLSGPAQPPSPRITIDP